MGGGREHHAPTPGAAGEDKVTISREAYELLHLKDRAMDSIKEGITIAGKNLFSKEFTSPR